MLALKIRSCELLKFGALIFIKLDAYIEVNDLLNASLVSKSRVHLFFIMLLWSFNNTRSCYIIK